MKKIVKKGLSMFNLRETPIQTDITDLPPFYALFMKLYNVCEKEFIAFEPYLDEPHGLYNFVNIVYLPNVKEISMGDFFSLEEASEAKQYAIDEGQRAFLEGKYRVIGIDGFGHHLFYVGIDPSTNLDQIFIDTEVFDGIVGEVPRLTKLADNIFEFMNGFAMVESIIGKRDENGILIPIDRLYKNWGEKFWRVREEPSKPDQ